MGAAIIFILLGVGLVLGAYIYIRKKNLFDYKNRAEIGILKYWLIHFFELEVLLLALGFLIFLLGVGLAFGEI